MSQPQQLYQECYKDVHKLLLSIGRLVDAHKELAEKQPHDWGYAGDMARWRHYLENVERELS